MDFKNGDKIIVKIESKEYETIIDNDVQRFPTSPLFNSMWKNCGLDLNKLAIAYHKGEFSKEEYLNFYLNIGYSVSGFAELSDFEDLKIENPLWD